MKILLGDWPNAPATYAVHDTVTRKTFPYTHKQLMQHPEIKGVTGDELTFYKTPIDCIETMRTEAELIDGYVLGDGVKEIDCTDNTKCINTEFSAERSASDQFSPMIEANDGVLRFPEYMGYALNYIFSIENLRNIRVFDNNGVFMTLSVRFAQDNANIEELYLSNVVSVPNYLASNCSKLRKAVIRFADKAMVKSFPISYMQNLKLGLGWHTFANCTSLEHVELDDRIEFFERYAFSNCLCLRNMRMPSALVVIGLNCFYDSGLESFEAPKGLLKIDDEAFRFCKNLRSVTLNEGLETIGEEAFMGCPELEYVELPDSLKFLNYNAFSQSTTISMSKRLYASVHNRKNRILAQVRVR